MKICKACKREFSPSSRHANCPACRSNARMHPCLDCPTLIRGSSIRCVPCNNTILASVSKPIEARKRRMSPNGYIMLSLPGRSNVAEHRIIMEQILGRELLPGENVHHINGIKTDNRPENRELWVTSQPTGQRPEDLVAWAHQIIKLYGDRSGSTTVNA